MSLVMQLGLLLLLSWGVASAAMDWVTYDSDLLDALLNPPTYGLDEGPAIAKANDQMKGTSPLWPMPQQPDIVYIGQGSTWGHKPIIAI